MADWIKDAAVIDFETLPIGDRPTHPPAPVGVAIKVGDRKARYLSWGHAAGQNTSTWGDARRELGELYASGRPLLFHHAKFDVEVGETHMGLPRLPWDRYHDTLPMLFLCDPRAPDFQLKPTAERLLGAAPEERDAVVDWLLEHQPVHGTKLSASRNSPNYAGACVAYAPAALAGTYACGDVDRTRQLAVKVFADLTARAMGTPYDRERELMLYILQMEQQGLRIDTTRLEEDCWHYIAALDTLEGWLRKRLKADASVNLDSGVQLAKALIKAGLASETDLGYTEKGALQTNKEALTAAVKDAQVLAALKYRTQLGTCLHTFMQPWLLTAQGSGGYIYTTWHSTRTDRGDSGVGTRTGRLSSTPNFMNLPRTFTGLFAEWATGAERKTLPKMPVKLPELPLVRSYIVPYERGHVLLDRDYSQQEPRILAHYEDGALLAAYQANPRIDFHTTVQQQLASRGIVLDRKPVKNLNLGLIYGMGLGKLAERVGRSVEETKAIKEAVLGLYPGLKDMYAEMRQRAKTNEPIRTWGGREYFCEDPKWANGLMMTFDYKMVNLLIQGSASDCTKEAMLRYMRVKPAHHRMLLTVHDQLTISAPYAERRAAMTLLREAMESVEFSVPMLSEGSWSKSNWSELEDWTEK